MDQPHLLNSPQTISPSVPLDPLPCFMTVYSRCWLRLEHRSGCRHLAVATQRRHMFARVDYASSSSAEV